MTRTLHITADPYSVSMAASIRAAAKVSPMLVLTVRALGELAAELGSMDAAAEFLLGIAEANHRPVGVNLPRGGDTSSTAFIAPRSWSAERLQGWIASRHQELAAEFGEVTWAGTA